MLFAIFIFALPIISSGWRRLRGLPLTTSAAREI
jgi:hypothetical protein